MICGGNAWVILASPISAAMLAAALVSLVAVTLPTIRSNREQAFQD